MDTFHLISYLHVITHHHIPTDRKNKYTTAVSVTNWTPLAHPLHFFAPETRETSTITCTVWSLLTWHWKLRHEQTNKHWKIDKRHSDGPHPLRENLVCHFSSLGTTDGGKREKERERESMLLWWLIAESTGHLLNDWDPSRRFSSCVC